MFSTAVFDLDGTLLDTIVDLANAGNYTLSVLHFPSHLTKKYNKMVGNGIHKLIERILPPDHRDSATIHLALTIFTEYYEKHKLDATAPYPGIMDMLDTLRSHHVKLAILSNKDDAFVTDIATHYFGNRFSLIHGLKSHYQPKPDPCSLLNMLKQLDSLPEDTLYCGDTDVDMMTANNAGITSCGVLWGFRDCDELLGAGADMLASSPSQLADIILNGLPSSK